MLAGPPSWFLQYALASVFDMPLLLACCLETQAFIWAFIELELPLALLPVLDIWLPGACELEDAAVLPGY